MRCLGGLVVLCIAVFVAPAAEASEEATVARVIDGDALVLEDQHADQAGSQDLDRRAG